MTIEYVRTQYAAAERGYEDAPELHWTFDLRAAEQEAEQDTAAGLNSRVIRRMLTIGAWTEAAACTGFEEKE